MYAISRKCVLKEGYSHLYLCLPPTMQRWWLGALRHLARVTVVGCVNVLTILPSLPVLAVITWEEERALLH